MIKTENAGVASLLEIFIEAAEVSLREALGGSSIGLFSTADETNLRAITGLQNILGTSTTTGTVGNINRATQTNWQHQSGNVASAFDTNGINIMNTLYRQCSRYDEVPDTIVLTGSAFDNFKRELTSTFQVNLPLIGVGPGRQEMLDAGFPNIRFNNAFLFHDDSVPANAGYFLNLKKYLKLYVREGRESELGDFVKSQTKDDLAAYVFFAGNLAATNLARMGILQNADTY